MSDSEQKSRSSHWKEYVGLQAFLLAAALVLGVIELYRRGDVYQNSIMPYLGLFDMAGVLAFLTVAVHFAWQFKLKAKQRIGSSFAYLCIYVVSYLALSLAGDYHASRSGNRRWQGTGLAVVDQNIWHAKGVFWQPFVTIRGQKTHHATKLGWFYAPLIQLDRRFWHDSVNLFEDDLDEWLARHRQTS